MGADITEVWGYASDLEYPASKLDVIAAVERRGARQQVVELLQSLPCERFENPEALQVAMSSRLAAADEEAQQRQ
jgi:hypothetical protein